MLKSFSGAPGNVETRITIALLVAVGLAMHGYRKRSLSFYGALSALFVGFVSFAVSYRFGVILILFYYTSSKLTKVKEEIKAKLEDGYVIGGSRGAVQVLACSLLGTMIAILFVYYIGEDCSVEFGSEPSGQLEKNILLDFPFFSISRKHAAAYLWSLYIAHYSTATADTWASELGILSKTNPLLITTLREVPRGTNGGFSMLGTVASIIGGTFIGLIFWGMSFLNDRQRAQQLQYPMIFVGLLCGFLGSLIDSILGATLQSTYYCRERKCIVKDLNTSRINAAEIERICGIDLLSNEAVNFISILLTMFLSIWLSPCVFCLCDQSQCL